ncbi:MAG: hypothetical protein A3B04_02725 [Candidatus Portnoybacteria bacterium RIFCSPLOWO2_02_FULL_39_11]|uniref:Uncharacterized protein n=1 Tax=Candidatus Portnoybacteria bacterium RIFCSPLOWO2_02_FULL_39_11 TaxID=1802001 RepID=A0A1G2FVW8_9BACT|nr:MAG: hypothetical protein A3B04_02725 [Candidatus Portnoybacteria bacterium RIFCSPLOWO2_02_FULL_39_11]
MESGGFFCIITTQLGKIRGYGFGLKLLKIVIREFRRPRNSFHFSPAFAGEFRFEGLESWPLHLTYDIFSSGFKKIAMAFGQSLQSYLGMLKHCNGYGIVREIKRG